MTKATLVVNVALVAACLVTCVDTVRRFAFSQPNFVARSGSIGPSRNEHIALNGIDWTKAPLTLVLAASKTCHFCAESAPFYRRLFSSAASRGLPVIMVTQDPEPEATREFFEGLDVHPVSVRRISFDSVRIKATPTLIAVDNYGKIAKVKVGTLRPDEEQQFLALVSDWPVPREESIRR